MDDLYAAVEVEPTASPTEIEIHIKKQYRVWNRRINSANLSKRQEAETRMALLARAREILLDPARRAAYDADLAAFKARRPEAAAPSTAAGTDWIERAAHYLEINDYRSAAYAAREARTGHGESAVVWELLSRANAGLGNLEDALYEARQAAQADPSTPERMLHVADILEELGDWAAAHATYERLRGHPGLAEEADIGIANILVNTERFAEAVPMLEHLRVKATQSQNREVAGSVLGWCLLSLAENVPGVNSPEGFLVTSPDEIERMRQLVARAASVTPDPHVQQAAGDLADHLRGCEAKSYWPSFPLGSVIKTGLLCGFGGLLLVGCGFDWTPALFAGLLLLAGGGLWIAKTVNDSHLTQWQINAAVQQWQQQDDAVARQLLNPQFLNDNRY